MPKPIKSLSNAPKSTLRWWGLQSAPAFDFAIDFLQRQGCDGPTTWKEGALVPFTMALGPTIKASVGLSAVSADNGYATFSCRAVIRSKTLHEVSEPSDPWMSGTKSALFEGFEPCIGYCLSHLKWCEREDSINPSWAMTLGPETNTPNSHVWAADFERLFTPLLKSLATDSALEEAMARAVAKAKPAWVKSDSPYFVFLPQRLARLKSRDLPR
jgi:hypothetical protein